MLYGSAQDFYHYLIQPGVMEKFIEGILYFSDTISLLKRTFQISLKEVYNRKKDIARL